MIKTSVIIPVYNTSSYLEECIDSVFNQTQKEIEVIVINDGSTDDSADVLLRLQKKYPRLIIIPQENHGQGYARNVGIEKARGEYIYFLDSDDYILEDTLESCYQCASENKLDIVVFDAYVFEDSIERKPIEPNNCDRHEIIKERKEVFSGIFFLQEYYRKSYIPTPWSLYCSAAWIKREKIDFLKGVYLEDNEFYCKAMLLADRVMYVPKMFYQYRCREDSTTGSEFNSRKARDHIEVINRMADLKTLRGGKGWYVVKKISLDLLLYITSMCHANNLYEEDSGFYRNILNTWMKICENSVESAADLEDIDCIYKICYFFPDSDFDEIKRQVVNRREQLLTQAFEKLPLNQKGSRVAIYGCGKYTDKVLDFYERWIGAIKADVIFLDRRIMDDNMEYRGYPVYSVREMKGKNPDYILISSPKYEEEMKSIVRQLYGNEFVITLLYGDLHINI